jgi:hypothetical protein
MKMSKLVLCAAAICASLGLTRSTNAVASETHVLHRSPSETFGIGIVSYSINHTWAESRSADASCTNNESESWPTFNFCVTNNSSGCRGDVSNATWLGTTSCNRALFQACYRAAPPGTYAYNGVCHQSTNRALAQTPVPFVNFLPVGGSDISYNIFHYYGTSWPWGNWYGAPC